VIVAALLGDLEGDHNMIARNAGNHSSNYASSYTRRLESSAVCH
jgi:hypothetical protein